MRKIVNIYAFDQQLIHEKPAMEGTIPTLDEKMKEEYKMYGCNIAIAYSKEQSYGGFTFLCNEERFLDIVKSLNPQFEIEYAHRIMQHFLAELLNLLKKYTIIDSNHLIRILQYKDNPVLEVFLTSKLTEQVFI